MAAAATDKGAQIMSPVMPVADLGQQVVLMDPTGASIGAWQPGTFPGFTAVDEDNAPCWYAPTRATTTRRSSSTRRSSAGRPTPSASPTSSATRWPRTPTAVPSPAGIVDATSWLGDDAPFWYTYWRVADVEAALATVTRLGGTIVSEPEDSTYGRLATVTEPTGAAFKLLQPPAK